MKTKQKDNSYQFKSFNNVFGMAKLYAKEIEAGGHTNSAKWLREDVEVAKTEYEAMVVLIRQLKQELEDLRHHHNQECSCGNLY
jgi:hypothetical protein